MSATESESRDELRAAVIRAAQAAGYTVEAHPSLYCHEMRALLDGIRREMQAALRVADQATYDRLSNLHMAATIISGTVIAGGDSWRSAHAEIRRLLG